MSKISQSIQFFVDVANKMVEMERYDKSSELLETVYNIAKQTENEHLKEEISDLIQKTYDNAKSNLCNQNNNKKPEQLSQLEKRVKKIKEPELFL